MQNQKSYEVLEGDSCCGSEGELILVEVDDDNRHVGEAFDYNLTDCSPIFDVIR
ncbi:hypothetical protein [Chengkuizengella axinellae]|uniref:DUF1292 domain-containing protein n=1 Tax=Chengkuizengella axinellae TaxID=3064388 RepID=A0ABT9J3I0_9BACL|nr:hypothetical protein [Chengkuizengella sp. 2205SS18-9]MDP5276177.1 hypothetical protein [Chengkuizengella sp. 2205SS18-9]